MHKCDEPSSEDFIVRWKAWFNLMLLNYLALTRGTQQPELAIATVVILRTCSSSGIDISMVSRKTYQQT